MKEKFRIVSYNWRGTPFVLLYVMLYDHHYEESNNPKVATLFDTYAGAFDVIANRLFMGSYGIEKVFIKDKP